MARFSGKVAVVTGGASGIGEASVRRMVAEDAKVVFADWDGERGERVAKEIAASGGPGKAVFVKADVSDEAACKALMERAAKEFGKLDILVNNAGIRMYQTVVEADAASWSRLLGVNLMSYVFCSKYAIPELRKAGGGTIVNIASVRSITAGEKTVQYDTAKGAIASLTRGMAIDHGPEGIRINAVCPGPIFTPFHAKRIADSGKSVEDYNKDAAVRTMLKRPGRPEEVAACILFMASDDASYCAGSMMYVDGGMTAI
jgi:2-hydroxycyclohexanecarboxyl-CoA dehydrogenase